MHTGMYFGGILTTANIRTFIKELIILLFTSMRSVNVASRWCIPLGGGVGGICRHTRLEGAETDLCMKSKLTIHFCGISNETLEGGFSCYS